MDNRLQWQVPVYEKYEFFEKKKKYCVIIPIINEGERIKCQLETMLQYNIQAVADIILCDGGSTDGSLDENVMYKNNVRTLLVKTGTGKLSAQLRMGFEYALTQGYEGIITIDGNNKDSVENIPDFITKVGLGIDFVQGSRFVKGGKSINTPWIRWLAIRLIHAPIVSLLSHFHFTDTTNGYRAYSRRLLLDSKINIFRNIFDTYELLPYLAVQAKKHGYVIEEIPVTRAYPRDVVPTKIKGIRGNVSLLAILWKLARGVYDSK